MDVDKAIQIFVVPMELKECVHLHLKMVSVNILQNHGGSNILN